MSGKTFDRPTCESILSAGYESSAYQLDIPNVDLNNVVVDVTRANACISGIAAGTCDDKGVPATELKTITQDCFAGLKGKLNADDPCHADVECKPGFYCEGAFDGVNYVPAGGACKALKQLGDACHQTDKFGADNCSSRGSGDSGRYCADDNTCQALIANDAVCSRNTRCSSGSCDPSSFAGGQVYCKTSHKDPFFCDAFVPVP